MYFNELRNGYPVYILNRTDMNVTTGKVINKGDPYFPKMNPNNPMKPMPTQRVVDVTIEIAGRTQTFTFVENSYVNSTKFEGKELVLSTEKQGIIKEVEVVKAEKESSIANYENDKATVEKCEKILSDWNPEFAEKKKQDERISNMEKKLDNMMELFQKYMENSSKK